MKAGVLVLLILLNTVIIVSYVQLSSLFYGPFDPHLISLVFSVLGIALGFLFYLLTKLSVKIRRLINGAIPIAFVLLCLIIYSLFGASGLIDALLSFFKALMVFILGAMAMLFSYGIFKTNKASIVVSGVGLLILYFLPAFLSQTFEFPLTNIWLVILFFTSYVFLLELASTSLFFSSIIDKMTPNTNTNTVLLQRFNMVIHSYVLAILFIFVFCLLFTGIVTLLSNVFISEGSLEFVSINLGSLSGLYVFVVVTLISVFLFWFLAPLSKRQGIIQFFRSNKN